MFSLPPLEQHQFKAVTCDMILRDLVPAAMLDCHARLVPHRFEAHVKLCRLAGAECRVTPSECKPFARLPDHDAADLELFPIRQRRNEPPAFSRLEPEMAVAARRQREQGVRPPPYADFLSEGFKRPQRCRVDPDRNDDCRGHLRFFSTCALKLESCAAHVASVSASQRFNSVMAPSFSV